MVRLESGNFKSSYIAYRNGIETEEYSARKVVELRNLLASVGLHCFSQAPKQGSGQ